MRKLLVVVGLFVAGFTSGNTLAAACAGFVDVDSTSGFCASVAWVKSRGITLGCTDASHYCPNDAVTRAQMAAFMYRLGFQNALLAGGNAFGSTAILGTTDNQPVEIIANGQPVMRYLPTAFGPNIIAGHPSNSANSNDGGQTIAGGGAAGSTCYEPSTGTYTRSCANQTESDFATIAGGNANVASTGAVVSGGHSNTASGGASAIAGGDWNTASGQDSAILAGQLNTASGNWSTVAGGVGNVASGDFSFAAGSQAISSAKGMFSWADSQPFTFDFGTYRYPQSSVDTFNVRATGGVVFVTDINPSNGAPTWECYTYSGAGWICSSDRNLKRNLIELNGSEVLAKLVSMPIYQWQPKDGPNAELKHIGPMAQDFYAAFHLGDSDKAIGMQDAEGVALAAIQGLYAKLKERDATIAEQQREIAELRQRLTQVESLRGEVAALRNAITTATLGAAVTQVDATAS